LLGNKKGSLKIIGVILVAALLSTCFIGCLGAEKSAIDKIRSRGTLIIGTSSGFVPFEMFNASSGQIEGFDIDIGRKIADRLHVGITIRDLGFNALVGSVIVGTVDVVIAGMTITPERNQSISFSNSYYGPADQAILVKSSSSIASVEGLYGKKIAVNLATTGDFWVDAELVAAGHVSASDVKRFPYAYTAIQDLLSGGVDAVIIDKPTADKYVSLNAGALKDSFTIVTNEYYGIAVRKSAGDLKDFINVVLADLVHSGEMQQLMDKWF
jgi:ABC-type amino acid transport substrate-binding protein